MKLIVSACCHPDYPITLEKAIISYSNGISESFHNLLNIWNWGSPYPFFIDSDDNTDIIPIHLDACWNYKGEKNHFLINEDLPIDVLGNLKKEGAFEYLVFGFAPCDGFTMWCFGQKKSSVIKSTQHVQSVVGEFERQFYYRHMIRFEHWSENKKKWQKYSNEEIVPEFDYIEESLFDGTHDKLHDGGLLKYHQAGKPKRLAIKWHIKKSDYEAYLWFDDMKIRDAFEWFYAKYPDAKMDFIFHIDTENKVFQISFNSEEADEPMLLSEDTYQMIIFKSKFEYYRTPNYNQQRGAWIW